MQNKSKKSSKFIRKFEIDSNVHFSYGSFFAHYLMNKDHKMEEITTQGFDGETITYSKSKSIMSYTNIIHKWWNNISIRRRKKMVKEWCIKHENLQSELILSNKKLKTNPSSDQLSISTSSQYLFEKLNQRKLKYQGNNNKGDPPIEIEFW